MHVQGYMVEATYEDGVLTAHGRNKAAQFGMSGKVGHDLPEGSTGDDVKASVHEASTSDLVLRREDIAGVELKDASMLVNGKLTIITTDGNRHMLHFRRKQRDGFHALADALRA
jgi:hypothetical protein